MQSSQSYMVKTWYTIFTTSAFHCPYCTKAIDLLRTYGVDFTVRDIHLDPSAREEFFAAGHKKVPQVYREDTLIGGSDKLQEHLRMTLIKAQEEKEIERKVKY